MPDKITIDRSVLEQALEALNASMPHNNNMDQDWPSHIAARRTLRAALEQPQGDPVGWLPLDGRGGYNFQQPPVVEQPQTVTDCHQSQPKGEPLTEADLYNIASNYFADEWAQRKAVMMLKDHGIGGEA